MKFTVYCGCIIEERFNATDVKGIIVITGKEILEDYCYSNEYVTHNCIVKKTKAYLGVITTDEKLHLFDNDCSISLK